MVVLNSKIKMLANQHCSRIDTSELKARIERKIGQQKSRKYFNLLSCYLRLKLSKSEFCELCISLIGSESICLHNELLRAIINNASIAKKPNKTKDLLSPKFPNGYHKSSLQSLCKDICPRKGRTPNLRERKKDRSSPLGPHKKTHIGTFQDFSMKVQEQQSATELISLGSSRPNSVEEGEEVEQASESPGIYSRDPVKAPFGVYRNVKETRKVLLNGSSHSFYRSELLDTGSLKNRVERTLENEGLEISIDCINLLNNGIDVFLKRLIKPCLELAGSRELTNGQNPNGSYLVSVLDFRVAMELNPLILGADWPAHLENICLRVFEESVGF